MNKKSVYAIGLMSGTSLDGLDLCYVEFLSLSSYEFNMLAAETVPYSSDWIQNLKAATQLNNEDLEALDVNYANFIGERVQDFINKFDIKALDFIASHGHTIFHQPDKGITKQIGDGQIISDITKRTVVADFRTQDVKLGGQGAPLVPIGDQLLFSEYEACVNLGGFANISYETQDGRVAFDICAVNTVLNALANKLGMTFDQGGKMASQGTLDSDLFNSLNNLAFFQETPPKSLGIEWVEKEVFPLLKRSVLSVENQLKTFTEHIAYQLGRLLTTQGKVLLTGGGTYNDYLINRLRYYSKSQIIIPEMPIIDYKEALIFALLGWLRLNNKVNCLSSVTGARNDHSSGRIFNPNFK